MRVCIWYEITRLAWGGSNSFLRALAGALKQLGHEVTFVPKPSDDVVLVNSWSRGAGRYLSIRHVKKVQTIGTTSLLIWLAEKIRCRGNKLDGVPLVHRVDGVAKLYGRIDPLCDHIQFQVSRLADFVIFQSHYSQLSFNQFGVIPRQSTVIYNGVDGKTFFPKMDKLNPRFSLKMIAVSWSSNIMKGFTWLPKLAALPGVEVCFVGNWCPSVYPGNVRLRGVKSPSEIADMLRESDVFVHAAENDPCSNAIVEALACGLPVLYRDSGGNKELAGKYGLPLEESLSEVVNELRHSYVFLRKKVLANRQDFLIEGQAKKYIKIFETIRKK